MKKLITVIMASLLLYSGYVLGTCAAADEVYTTKTVTVYSGDTMWDIASRWTEDGEDVRAVIYRICEANGLICRSALLSSLLCLYRLRCLSAARGSFRLSPALYAAVQAPAPS